MLQLTPKHIILLNLFVDYGDMTKGISSYEIGKRGYSRKTFGNNQVFLLENRAIKIVRSVKAGKQRRKFYDITPLGFFSFLKTLPKTEFKREIKSKRSKSFFPIISDHWDEIVKFHHGQENILLEVLRFSINNLELTNYPHQDDEFEASSSLKLSTTINTNGSLSLTLKQFFVNYTDYDLKIWDEINRLPPLKMSSGVKIPQEKLETIQENIVDQLSFLFYFNLLGMLKPDSSLFSNIYSTLYQSKKKYKNFEDRFADYNDNGYNKMIKNNPTLKTIQMIEKDKELKKIIETNLKKWNTELKKNHLFKEILTVK